MEDTAADTLVEVARVAAERGESGVRVEERAEGELIVMSKKGQVIKLPLKDVPSLGRQTQGVKVMKMRAGDSIASIVYF